MRSWNAYRGMTGRNIRVYMKDKTTILMSLMTPIIIFGLFVLFLKNNYADSIRFSMDKMQQHAVQADIDSLVNAWMVAGVLATAVITVALESLSVVVADRQSHVSYDCAAAPVKPATVVLSYFSGAFINTVLVSAVLTAAGMVFLGATGTVAYSAAEIAKLFGLTVLGAVSATIILLLLVSFVKKVSVYSSLGVLISAAIGFVIGAYVPVSQFSPSVQTAVNLVPGSQVAGMIRNVLLTPAIEKLGDSMSAPAKQQLVAELRQVFAVDMELFGEKIGVSFMMLYTLAGIAVFLVLNLLAQRFIRRK